MGLGIAEQLLTIETGVEDVRRAFFEGNLKNGKKQWFWPNTCKKQPRLIILLFVLP